MKKTLLGLAALGILFLASCKKSDDNNTPSNSFKIGGTSYTASIVTSSGSGGAFLLVGADGTGPSMSFAFASTPVSGTYKVGNSTGSSANEVTFIASTGSKTYSSTGFDNVNATVTVNGGKVTVSMPDATGRFSSTDSVKVSGSITQP